jgi:hypothetical protein
MVFNATFNNISAISWQSVLLVEETGVPGKKPASISTEKVCVQPKHPKQTTVSFYIYIYYKSLNSVVQQMCNKNTLKNNRVVLMPLSTIFQLYRGSQFYWWRKQEYLEKTPHRPQGTDKLYHSITSHTHGTKICQNVWLRFPRLDLSVQFFEDKLYHIMLYQVHLA